LSGPHTRPHCQPDLHTTCILQAIPPGVIGPSPPEPQVALLRKSNATPYCPTILVHSACCNSFALCSVAAHVRVPKVRGQLKNRLGQYSTIPRNRIYCPQHIAIANTLFFLDSKSQVAHSQLSSGVRSFEKIRTSYIHRLDFTAFSEDARYFATTK
jgi:hypothetical protein